MSPVGNVDGGLLERGNKLAVKEIAAVALHAVLMLRPTDDVKRAALLCIADGLRAICNAVQPSKAFKAIPSDTVADALAVINSAPGQHDALDWLREVLTALSDGVPANDAFGWKGPRHRANGNLTLRNWIIRTEVHEEMRRDTRPSWRAACASVADQVCLSTKLVEQIAKGVTAEVVPDIPLSTPQDTSQDRPRGIYPAADLQRLRRAGILRRVN